MFLEMERLGNEYCDFGEKQRRYGYRYQLL